ncbi:hypothetical protein B0H14DRAFT_3498679 [Mycena olivaceomarginata]|nr:hypothetical protein B0H14DRAFT_3498679 [Mycena olivaceomarginata]
MSPSKSTTALGVNVDVVLDAVTHVPVFVCVSARVGTSFELRKRHSSPAPARAGPSTTSGDESEAQTGGKLPWSTQLRSGLGPGRREKSGSWVAEGGGTCARASSKPEASVELGATGAQ